jgi:hypothetical protein
VRVLLFGATGMVGQGVLRECLLDPGVENILSIGRSTTGQTSPKLRELVLPHLLDASGLGDVVRGFDACFFWLGVSSIGMKEEDYRRVTLDLTLAVAGFSGSSRDDVHLRLRRRHRQYRARAKHVGARQRPDRKRTSAASLQGRDVPARGNRLHTGGTILDAAASRVSAACYDDGAGRRAMLHVARVGAPKSILETRDINAP